MNVLEIPPEMITDAVSQLIDARDAARDKFNQAKSVVDLLKLRRNELDAELLEQDRQLASTKEEVADVLIARGKPKIINLLEAAQRVDLLALAITRADRLGPRRQVAALQAESDFLIAEFELQEAVGVAEKDAALEALRSIGNELGDGAGVDVTNGKWDLRRQASLELAARAAEVNGQAENLQARLAQLENV